MDNESFEKFHHLAPEIFSFFRTLAATNIPLEQIKSGGGFPVHGRVKRTRYWSTSLAFDILEENRSRIRISSKKYLASSSIIAVFLRE